MAGARLLARALEEDFQQQGGTVHARTPDAVELIHALATAYATSSRLELRCCRAICIRPG